MGGQRIDGAQPIDDTDALRIGDRVEARVVGAPAVLDRGANAGALLIEDEASGVRIKAPTPPFTIGGGAGDGVRLQGLEPGAVAVVAEAPGGLTLDPDEVWAAGARRSVGERALRLIRVAGAMAATVGQDTDLPEIHVEVTLEGAAGAEAWVSAVPGGAPVLVGSGNRAALVYLLARRLQADRDAGIDADTAGWCSDEDLGVGVWGRAWMQQDVNGLHVLIYRLRKGLQSQGFDADVVQKRRKATRLQALRVTVR